MTLNVSEACAINLILHWHGVPNVPGTNRPTDEQARAAYQLLAEAAHKRLGAGCRPDDVRTAIEHTAARINRWAEGKELDQWRVVVPQVPNFGDGSYEVWSTDESLAEAQEDLSVSGLPGSIEHRRLWSSDWKAVEQ